MQDTLLEFLARLNANALEESASHFSEYGFDQVNPRTVFRGVDIDEAVGPRSEIGHGFLGNMRRMIVQDHPDSAFLG